MKGSQKFWSIIGIIFMIYGNYLSFFTDFVPKGDEAGKSIELVIGIFVVLGDLALIVVIIGVFFAQILPKFNNWLDEKF